MADDLEKLLEEKLKGASSQANNPIGGLFAGTPYAQYQVYLGGGAPMKPGFNYQHGAVEGSKGGSTLPSPSATGYVDYQTAVLAPARWGEDTLRNFVNQGIINKVPGFEPGMGLPQVQAVWQKMVDSSIMFNQAQKPGEKPWSPWDVLNTWQDNKGKFGTKREGDWVYDVATGERIKYVGPTKKTTTQKNIDLSSAADVKAIATQALRELLGRAPTAKEMAQFRASINAEERANPTVVTTTQTLKPDLASGTVDVVASDSTTSGGVSDAARAALIQDPTMDTKEYGKYQAATTYWDSMMQMLAGGF